jgi:hypothetical protein
MMKLAVRFLMLSMLTTGLLVGPVVTQANAATQSSKEITKKKRVAHRSHVVARTRAAPDPGANPFASKYEDDFDRRNAGGGGGY